jgi:3-deoxy-D-manno-octulosonate 8-phosphate phosphatase (KDO 8-P phosphatase)
VNNLPKLVITDIDGVWTDGGMYYGTKDNELKKFNTSDSAGVLFLRLQCIPTAIITGEDTDIVRSRARKLNIENVFCGASNKLAVATRLCEELNITLDQVAFVGDDLNDVHLLRKVRWSACPANACDYVKQLVQMRLTKSGGEGAFREFAERLLKDANKLDETIEQFLLNLEKPT